MLKKIIIFLLFGSIVFGVEKYEILDVDGIPMIFPKSKTKYLGELIDENKDYFEIARVYSLLGNKENALRYLDKSIIKDYRKLSNIYKNLDMKDEQFLSLEKALKEDVLNLNGLIYYHKILSSILVSDELLTKQSTYKKSLNELLLIDDIVENGRVELIKNLSYSDNNMLFKTMLELNLLNGTIIENSNHLSLKKKYYRDLIKSVDDKKSYYAIFDLFPDIKDELNSLELLHYYNYVGDISRYEELKKELINQYKDEPYTLYLVYKITNNYKLAYNLALSDKAMHRDFIDYLIKNNKKDKVINVIESYLTLYQSYDDYSIYKLYMERVSDDKKLAITNRYLSHKFDHKIFLNKIKIMRRANNIYGLHASLKNIIFEKGLERREYIEEYINNHPDSSSLGLELKELIDKNYYAEFAIKNGLELDEKYGRNILNYYIKVGETQYIDKYLDYLKYDDFDSLISRGLTKYITKANEKYPFEKKWMDKKDIKNFYFFNGENYFTDSYVSELLNKSMKRDVEEYFLYRYYLFNSKRGNAEIIKKRLEKKYEFI